MREYFTESLVLDKEPSGESDTRVFLYTQIFGKVIAKATSSRKITSKLAGHLEPLNLVKVRLIEKNSLQIADALKFDSLETKYLGILKLINETAAEYNPDSQLWSLIKNKNCAHDQILKVSGFDPVFALCANCGRAKPDYFVFKESSYLCRICLIAPISHQDYFDLSRVSP